MHITAGRGVWGYGFFFVAEFLFFLFSGDRGEVHEICGVWIFLSFPLFFTLVKGGGLCDVISFGAMCLRM